MHDGSHIILHKLGKDYDPTNKAQAIQAIHGAIAEGKFLTGLIYYNPNRKEFAEELNLCDIPLVRARPRYSTAAAGSAGKNQRGYDEVIRPRFTEYNKGLVGILPGLCALRSVR